MLQVGSDADLAIWDPRIETVITQQMLHHGADYTPFEGFKVQGWPTTMLLGGNTVIRERRQIEPKCLGNYIARNVGGDGLETLWADVNCSLKKPYAALAAKINAARVGSSKIRLC